MVLFDYFVYVAEAVTLVYKIKLNTNALYHNLLNTFPVTTMTTLKTEIAKSKQKHAIKVEYLFAEFIHSTV